MKNSEVKEMVDGIEDYVKNASVDELTGRMFRLGIEMETSKDDKKNAKTALEIALIVAFVEEKE